MKKKKKIHNKKCGYTGKGAPAPSNYYLKNNTTTSIFETQNAASMSAHNSLKNIRLSWCVSLYVYQLGDRGAAAYPIVQVNSSCTKRA